MVLEIYFKICIIRSSDHLGKSNNLNILFTNFNNDRGNTFKQPHL